MINNILASEEGSLQFFNFWLQRGPQGLQGTMIIDM